MLKPGQLFAGRYRIERPLAQGGMGAVFVAEQVATEVRVAIKVLWPQTLASSDAIEKFKLEARIAGRVDSENIVRVLDAGFDEETRMPYLTMELLKGQDLAKVVATNGPLSPELVVRYMNDVALGLDRAHRYVDREGIARPIVHRDLKPENLFLAQRDQGGPIVKILDFGIAKVASDTNMVSQEVRGTPLFMAFEQASGEAVGPQTDVWSLGLVVYWLLSGKHYWKAGAGDGQTLKRLFGELLVGELVPASVRAREGGLTLTWPAGFDAWFGRCVNRDVKARFASAGDAVAELGRVFGVRVPSARPQAAPSEERDDIARAATLKTPVLDSGGNEGIGESASRPAVSVTHRSFRIKGARTRWVAVIGATTMVGVATMISIFRAAGTHSNQSPSAATFSALPASQPTTATAALAAPPPTASSIDPKTGSSASHTEATAASAPAPRAPASRRPPISNTPPAAVQSAPRRVATPPTASASSPATARPASEGLYEQPPF